METNSTQAVEADTTLNATPVKRWKRGDVREDGMVFWAYDKTYKSGEVWFTAGKVAAKRAKDLAAHKRSYAKNPEKVRASRKHSYAKNPEKQKQASAAWSRKNKLRVRAYQDEYVKNRRRTDPIFALKLRLRCRVYSALKRKGFKKNTKTALMLGCTYEEFRAHIERLFLPGMSWTNFSDGHIDHLVPLDAADTEADVYALNHFTNLRPMWGPDNCSKNAKLPAEHELPVDLHPKVREIWQRAKDSACTK